MSNLRRANPLAEPQGPLLKGYVARADSAGARLIPWHEADTVGPAGASRIKRRQRSPVRIGPPPGSAPLKTTDVEKVDRLARMLFSEVEKTRYVLKRDPVASDFPDALLAAIGGELWKAGEPVTFDRIRQVAMRYVHASKVGNPESDPNFKPGDVR